MSGFFLKVIVDDFNTLDVVPLARSRDNVLLQGDVGDGGVRVVDVFSITVSVDIEGNSSSGK